MKGRDPRLSQTVRTPGYTRIGENETLVQEFGSTVTGYQMIKFVTERKWDTNNKDINECLCSFCGSFIDLCGSKG